MSTASRRQLTFDKMATNRHVNFRPCCQCVPGLIGLRYTESSLRLMWHNFTNSQHLLITFGRDNCYDNLTKYFCRFGCVISTLTKMSNFYRIFLHINYIKNRRGIHGRYTKVQKLPRGRPLTVTYSMIELYLSIYEQICLSVIADDYVITARCRWRRAFSGPTT